MRHVTIKREKVDFETIICICIMVMVSVLLFLRDANGYPISKYVFLILLAPVLMFTSQKNVFKVWAFIMPLYVGLPGNLLTLVMLVRFVLHGLNNRKMRLVSAQFCFTLILVVYIVVQNLLLGFNDTYNMIYAVELVVLYFVMTSEHRGLFADTFLFYTCGVALVGIVMLVSTLRVASFNELLSAASRLGYLGRDNEMNIIVDPNYYGLFAITAVSGHWCMISESKYTLGKATFAIVVTLICMLVSIIGLSRAFVLCMIGWSVLAFFTESRGKLRLVLISVVVIMLTVVVTVLPESVDAVIERFKGDDMATGNGRTDLVKDALSKWAETPLTILLGFGLFNCHAHCMPLQYFAGLGVVGFIVVAGLYISYWSLQNECRTKRFSWKTMVPIIVVQALAATVPIAQSMTFMMPVVMSILVYGEVNRS